MSSEAVLSWQSSPVSIYGPSNRRALVWLRPGLFAAALLLGMVKDSLLTEGLINEDADGIEVERDLRPRWFDGVSLGKRCRTARSEIALHLGNIVVQRFLTWVSPCRYQTVPKN